MNEAILICGHGSREAEAVSEFERVVAACAARVPDRRVGYGFLELVRPTIADGLQALTDGGARRILVLPAMLFSANHVRRDIPAEIARFADAHPGIEVRLGRGFESDPKMLDAARNRIEAVSAAGSRTDSVLLVIGRGTGEAGSDTRFHGLVTTLAERMGFARGLAAFAGMAAPGFAEGLDQAARIGLPRVVLFPYFLFTGVLVKRIYEAADQVAAQHSGLQILKAGTLADHPRVIEALLDRINPPAN
jgi:sirohydrochlorin cobaltochelatase